MQLIRQAEELHTEGRKTCVAIGMFDGVHLGHQQVIRQTISDAKQHHGLSVAITFDKHPSAVLAPARAPRLVYSLSQKLKQIENLGVDAILLIEFTKEFSQQPAEEFIRKLARDFRHIFSISVGEKFTFGHKRVGNVELLRRLGLELNFKIHGIASVSLDARTVSSTRIREQIAVGNLDAASQMLGRSYSISGRVIRGDQLGRKLGVPTANLAVAGLQLPPNGVYAAIAQMPDGARGGVINIGYRPTLKNADPELRFELHVFDYEADLYDRSIEVTPLNFIRAEQRFESLSDLKAQIDRDIAAVRGVLSDFV